MLTTASACRPVSPPQPRRAGTPRGTTNAPRGLSGPARVAPRTFDSDPRRGSRPARRIVASASAADRVAASAAAATAETTTETSTSSSPESDSATAKLSQHQITLEGGSALREQKGSGAPSREEARDGASSPSPEEAAPPPLSPSFRRRNGTAATPDAERLRRARISAAIKGRKPWNRGKPHSPQTLERIRTATAAAMAREDVRAKLKAAALARTGSGGGGGGGWAEGAERRDRVR